MEERNQEIARLKDELAYVTSELRRNSSASAQSLAAWDSLALANSVALARGLLHSISLGDSYNKDNKIMCIKMVRTITGMSL